MAKRPNKDTDKLILSGVKSKIKALKRIEFGHDEESRHCEWDELNEQFIMGISLGWYSMVEMLPIAKELRKLNDSDLERWYA